jgi:hypothetical protein
MGGVDRVEGVQAFRKAPGANLTYPTRELSAEQNRPFFTSDMEHLYESVSRDNIMYDIRCIREENDIIW